MKKTLLICHVYFLIPNFQSLQSTVVFQTNNVSNLTHFLVLQYLQFI